MSELPGPVHQPSQWAFCSTASYSVSTDEGSTLRVSVILDSNLRSQFCGVRLILLGRVGIASDMQALVDHRSMIGSKPNLRIKDQGISVQQRPEGLTTRTRSSYYVIPIEILFISPEYQQQNVAMDYKRSPQSLIRFSLISPTSTPSTDYRILYDNISASTQDHSGVHHFRPFVTAVTRPNTAKTTCFRWTFHVQSLERKEKQRQCDLPRNILQTVAFYLVSRKRDFHWRKNLLHFGLVRRSWTFVHEMFLDIFFKQPWKWNRFSPPLQNILCYIDRDVRRADRIKTFNVMSAYHALRNLANDEASKKNWEVFIKIFKHTSCLTTVSGYPLGSVPAKLRRELFNAFKQSPGVQKFTWDCKGSDDVVSMEDLLILASNWVDLRSFEACKWRIEERKPPETQNEQEKEVHAADPCADASFRHLEKLALEYGTLTGLYMRCFVSPTLRSLTLGHISGLRMCDLRSFLIQTSPTLEKIHIYSCEIGDDKDAGEYAIDAVVPMLNKITYMNITSEVASELVISGKLLECALKAESRLQFTLMENAPEPTKILNAIKISAWDHIALHDGRREWNQDEIRDAKRLKGERLPTKDFVVWTLGNNRSIV